MKRMISDFGNEALTEAAFARVEGELRALRTDELLRISLEISGAVATVLGVLPEVKALREEILKHLPTFEIERFDKLEDYALALSHTNFRYLAATQKPDDFEPLVEEAAKMRERLLAEARSLIHHGVVTHAQLSQLRGAQGAKNIATDLGMLKSVMQEAWPAIQGKTLTTTEDLDAASRLATRVLRALGLRDQSPAIVAEVADLRARAYTTLMLAYDDARRAIQYLRSATDDADDIAPGLHPGRPGRRNSEPATEAPVNAPNSAAVPSAAPNGGGSAAPRVPVGLPTSDPFVR